MPDAPPGAAERLLFATASLLACRIDPDGTIVEANAALEQLAGSALAGTPVADLADDPWRSRLALFAVEGTEDEVVSVGLLSAAPATPVSVTMRIARDHAGAVLVGEVQPDTPAALDVAPRQSAVVIEIDALESVGERYGRDVRDALVGLVHDVLEAGARGSDQIAPTDAGGFSVVLDNCVLDGALVWAERVRARLREIRALGNGEALTACFGVAERHAGEATDDAVERAGAALRIARSDGRDKVRAAR